MRAVVSSEVVEKGLDLSQVRVLVARGRRRAPGAGLGLGRRLVQAQLDQRLEVVRVPARARKTRTA